MRDETQAEQVQSSADSQADRGPKLLVALRGLLEKAGSGPAARQIVRWNREGTCFEVLNPMALILEMLSKGFKHTKYSSFIRQA